MRIKQGSLVNVLMDNSPTQADPQPGDGGTIAGYTDRYPCTVVSARRTKVGWLVVEVQEDDAKRVDSNGISEHQEYEYTRNPNAPIQVFRARQDGVLRNGSRTLVVGQRNRYWDPSF